MRECVYNLPLPLLSNSYPKKLRDIVEKMFPYECGFEFECITAGKADYQAFYDAGCINCSIGHSETSFRIPSGIKGLVCLYKCMDILNDSYHLNNQSSLHIHLGIKELFYYSKYSSLLSFCENDLLKENILKRMDKIGYSRSYNKRRIIYGKGQAWLNVRNDYETLEFRIFDQKFDYTHNVKMLMFSIATASRILAIVK